MSSIGEIKEIIVDIKDHYDKHCNSKYTKGILLKLDLPHSVKHEMNTILVNDLVYLDSRGTLEDLYNGIKSIAFFIHELKAKVIPNISNYTSGTFLSAPIQSNPNEKILMQMAIKNYPMNIKILADKTYMLLTKVLEFDNSQFSDNPAYNSIKGFDEIGNALQYSIDQKK
jgi:hypothetical protein